MKVLSELDFGMYIAFFLPGVLALYAMGPLSPRIAELFVQVVTKDQSLGASLLLVIAGLVVGTVVSGLRAVSLDWTIQKLGQVPKPTFNYKNLSSRDTRAAYKEALNNTYRFYQFYGNMCLSLAFFVLIRYVLAGVDFRSEKALFSLALITLIGLFEQSRQSLKGTYNVLGQILGTTSPELGILTGSALPSGRVGEVYDHALDASGGKAPYKWTQIMGTLPSGLSLDPSGGIRGTPTTQGSANVAMQVADSAGTAKSQIFSIKIE